MENKMATATMQAKVDAAYKKLDSANDYIKQMDSVIDDNKIARSCINPLEDLRIAVKHIKSTNMALELANKKLRDVVEKSLDAMQVSPIVDKYKCKLIAAIKLCKETLADQPLIKD